MKKVWIYIIMTLIVFSKVYSLSLEEAKEFGLTNSPIIKSAEEALNQAKWDYYQSSFELLPSANLNTSYAKYDPTVQMNVKNNKSYGLQASQVIFAGGKIWLNRDIKKNMYEIAQVNYKQKRIEIIAEIENKFFTSLERQQQLHIAENEYNNAMTNEQIAQIRYNNGSIAEADLLRMKAQTVQKKVNHIQAKTNALSSIIDLQNTLGISEDISPQDLDREIFIYNMFDVIRWEMSQINSFIDKISKLSLVNNTNIKIFDLNVKNAQNQLTMAKGSFLPTINLSFSKNYSKTNLDNDYSDSSTLMLNASIPLLPTGNNISSYLKNKAMVRKIEADFIVNENSINLNSRTVALAWISAIQTAQSAELSLEYAEKSWQQMSQRYQSGVISSSDMLDAEIMLSNARSQFISSRYNILRNKSNLKKLLNIESDEEFSSLIKD